jgi:hypothetical protein
MPLRENIMGDTLKLNLGSFCHFDDERLAFEDPRRRLIRTGRGHATPVISIAGLKFGRAAHDDWMKYCLMAPTDCGPDYAGQEPVTTRNESRIFC